MAQLVSIPDPVYQALERLAQAQGQTPEELIAAWVAEHAEEGRDPLKEPHYQAFEEFFHDLGMTDEQIATAQQRASDHADI